MSLILEISAAAELRQELDRLESADSNLSIKGALSECKRNGATDKEADRIIAEIEAGTDDGRMLKVAFSRLVIATKNFRRSSILKPSLMSVYLGDSVEALSRMQCSRSS